MNGKRKVLILSVLIAMVLAVGGIGAYYWYNNTYYISTEDAKVTGDLVKASTQISAKLLDLNVEEGTIINKNTIIARQELTGVDDSKIDTSVVRAPITGIVIKKQGTIGEFVSAGQTIAMLVDPNKLYINANIEETKLSKLQKGQPVDITVDQYEGVKLKGKVESIGQATAATFSMLPSSSSSTFTKVVQKVPVKIEIDSTNIKLLPGTNAVLKIHIK